MPNKSCKKFVRLFFLACSEKGFSHGNACKHTVKANESATGNFHNELPMHFCSSRNKFLAAGFSRDGKLRYSLRLGARKGAKCKEKTIIKRNNHNKCRKSFRGRLNEAKPARPQNPRRIFPLLFNASRRFFIGAGWGRAWQFQAIS